MQDLLIEYKRALKDARKRYEPFREKEDKQLSDQEKHDKKLSLVWSAILNTS